MKRTNIKKTRKPPISVICGVLAVVLLVSGLSVLISVDEHSLPFSADCARRTIIKEETTKKASDSTPTAETAEAGTEQAIPEQNRLGAFVCRISCAKTAWQAGEQPIFNIEYGLLDSSLGEGKLQAVLTCNDLELENELSVERFTFDVYPGKNSATAELKMIRNEKTKDKEFSFGKFFLNFVFTPDEDNPINDEYLWYDYDYYDDDDYDYDEQDKSARGIWVGGFSCSYSITPCEIAFSRHETASADFFAERLYSLYSKSKITDSQLRDGYRFLTLFDKIFIFSSSPISDGKASFTYNSSTLSASSRDDVSDEEVIKLISKFGPYYDYHVDKNEKKASKGRELSKKLVDILKDQGVISDDEYQREYDNINEVEIFVSSPPEFIKKFSRFKSIIESKEGQK